MITDLRSDTVTRPDKAMLDFMFSAEVGDMVLDEDPMVNRLEEYTAKLFNKEAGLYCPSGTMTNQVAIKLHTQPGDDVICSKLAHIYLYEGGGIAFNSGASVTLIDTPNGIFSLDEVEASIQPDDPHRPRTSLVSIENTANRGGGATWNLDQMTSISDFCRDRGFAFHLDGARIFNAIVATGYGPGDIGPLFDTVSICLSKGLGAPVGSVLTGSSEHIARAKRIRKVLGGTMRQAGYLAAAGIYALENNVKRLSIDHLHAKAISVALKKTSWVKSVMDVDTNIVIFELADGLYSNDIIKELLKKDILVSSPTSRTIRLVTHLDITTEMVEHVLEVIGALDPGSKR